MELGITRPSDDFFPQGTLITVHRARLLEVKHVFMSLAVKKYRYLLCSSAGVVNLSEIHYSTKRFFHFARDKYFII